MGLCRQTPAARSTTPGRPTQTPKIADVETRVADAPAHPVLDQIGDHRGRLAIDSDRQVQRTEDVGAEVRHRNGDLVGRELHADDMRCVRVELEHDARPAAAGVANGAELQRDDQPRFSSGSGINFRH